MQGARDDNGGGAPLSPSMDLMGVLETAMVVATLPHRRADHNGVLREVEHLQHWWI